MARPAGRVAVMLTALLLLAPLAPAAAQTPAQSLPDFTRLVEQYGASVVSISAASAEEASPLGRIPIPEDSPFYEYFRKFFEELPEGGGGLPERQTAMGSGFIISADGFVLTNAHVVQDAVDVTVTLTDRRDFKAKVIGADKRSDVALIKIEGKDLPVAPIGDSGGLQVGQWVLAIGSPFGLEYTATQGIISALGRSLPTDAYVTFIQTDAAINPGNSGGPLFNLAGEVIGVNAQIYSQTGGYMGVSFAIPINAAMDVVKQLKSQGRVSRGWLGVVVQEVSADLARSFGLERARGALVSDVVPKGPAAEAGVQAGDIIISYNGQPIDKSSQLPPLVGRSRAGTQAPMVIVREGREQTLQVKVAELPEERPEGKEKRPQKRNGSELGLAVAPLPPDSELKQGVVVEQVHAGPAATAGILPGDILLRLNQQEVKSPEQLAELVRKLPRGRPVPLLLHRRGQPLFLALTVPE